MTMRSEVSPMRIEFSTSGNAPIIYDMKRIDTVLHDEGFRADVRKFWCRCLDRSTLEFPRSQPCE